MAANRLGVTALALTVCLLFHALPGVAQTSFATLKGSITDEQNEYNLDVRVGKNFKLRGRMAAGIFWEMFNVSNTDNFQAYQGSLESSAFGRPSRALPKRRQQFGFRFDF